MATASLQFLGFCLVVVLLYNLLAPLWWRRLVLLGASLWFLASFSHDPLAFVPLACFLAFGFFGLRLMQRESARIAFVPILLAVLCGFFWLKKYSFFPIGGQPGFPYLTLGLSYIFFRVLHLLIDARDGNLPQAVGPIGYLNYLLNFTTLVSGPIQLYPDFAASQECRERPPLTLVDLGRGLERIAVGFFKIAVLSAAFSALQQQAIEALSPQQAFAPRALTGALIAASYPVYLYFNFSGYTDMVIGIAAFLRLRLPENFDRPFAAGNFIDFWGRWHMTLSNWLKTYVFNPLLMVLIERFPSPRATPFLGVVAFFVTFFLIGVWHGQTPIFLVYGVLLGLGVSVNKLYQVWMTQRLGRKAYRALCERPWYRAAGRGLSFTWFTLSLLCFWSSGPALAGMARSLGPEAIVALWVSLWIAATVLLSILEGLRHLILALPQPGAADIPLLYSRYLRTVWVTTLVLVTAGTLLVLDAPAPDIVYKAF